MHRKNGRKVQNSQRRYLHAPSSATSDPETCAEGNAAPWTRPKRSITPISDVKKPPVSSTRCSAANEWYGLSTGKKNRNEIADRVSRHRRGHHRPERAHFPPGVQDAGQNRQVEEVAQVGHLHEIVQRRPGKLLEPHRGVHARQPVIESDQPAVAPAGEDQMHQVVQLLEAEQKKTPADTSAS